MSIGSSAPSHTQEGNFRSMQDPAVQTCPHGLRPGTTVCLHCRHDARVAARQRRYRLLARAGLIMLGGGAVIALVIGGVVAIAPAEDSAIAAAGESTTIIASAGAPTTASNSPPAVTPVPTPAERPALRPTIPEGRRELGDSMYAVREGANVTVHFDTETLRTRFDWKFEGVVRATLPLVYGDVTRPALDSIPSGTLVRGGDMLAELPTRGFPIAVGDEQLRVWPITRPGRDGPLVVGYRATAAK
jgi:hypothetical protein